MVTAAIKLRRLFLGKVMTNLDSLLKSRGITLPTKKGPSSQSYGFPCNHVWMWEVGYNESWAPKNWCFWIVVLEKTLESPLDCKEIQPVHPLSPPSPPAFNLPQHQGLFEEETRTNAKFWKCIWNEKTSNLKQSCLYADHYFKTSWEPQTENQQ